MIFHILRHVMQIIIRNQNQTEADHRRPKQPCADRDPHGCSDPKTRCRRQTANLSAIGHDDRGAILPASFVACRSASLKYAGTVITASVTFSPRYASAVAFKF